MSTQIRFDIEGLSRAIELGDARYQLALYADDAEVSLVDDASPTSGTPLVLRGRSAIADWIENMGEQMAIRRVLTSTGGVDNVTLLEERQTVDGSNFRYACTAEVHGGRITRETVTRNQPQAASAEDHPGGHFLG